VSPSSPTPTAPAWSGLAAGQADHLVGAELAQLVAELADAGFGGIEAIYGRYSPRQRQELGNLARRFDLVATGGSDHHGTAKPDLTVGTGRGDLKVPDAVLTRLEERRPGD
jgi:sugar phosphate isomerase/epimerase